MAGSQLLSPAQGTGDHEAETPDPETKGSALPSEAVRWGWRGKQREKEKELRARGSRENNTKTSKLKEEEERDGETLGCAGRGQGVPESQCLQDRARPRGHGECRRGRSIIITPPGTAFLSISGRKLGLRPGHPPFQSDRWRVALENTDFTAR